MYEAALFIRHAGGVVVTEEGEKLPREMPRRRLEEYQDSIRLQPISFKLSNYKGYLLYILNCRIRLMRKTYAFPLWKKRLFQVFQCQDSNTEESVITRK